MLVPVVMGFSAVVTGLLLAPFLTVGRMKMVAPGSVPDWMALTALLLTIPWAWGSARLLGTALGRRFDPIRLSHWRIRQGTAFWNLLLEDSVRFAPQRLEKVLAEDRPYVLYLRNAILEEGAVQSVRRSRHWTDGLSSADVVRPPFEEALLSDHVSGLPVFCLCNPGDLDPSGFLNHLCTSEHEWFAVVQHMAERASKIVAVVTEPTAGVVRELDMLVDIGAKPRAIILAPTDSKADWIPNELPTQRFDLPPTMIARPRDYP